MLGTQKYFTCFACKFTLLATVIALTVYFFLLLFSFTFQFLLKFYNIFCINAFYPMPRISILQVKYISEYFPNIMYLKIISFTSLKGSVFLKNALLSLLKITTKQFQILLHCKSQRLSETKQL